MDDLLEFIVDAVYLFFALLVLLVLVLGCALVWTAIQWAMR